LRQQALGGHDGNSARGTGGAGGNTLSSLTTSGDFILGSAPPVPSAFIHPHPPTDFASGWQPLHSP
jgi:hypothetical protein